MKPKHLLSCLIIILVATSSFKNSHYSRTVNVADIVFDNNLAVGADWYYASTEDASYNFLDDFGGTSLAANSGAGGGISWDTNNPYVDLDFRFTARPPNGSVAKIYRGHGTWVLITTITLVQNTTHTYSLAMNPSIDDDITVVFE
jgi:hypothetical protein